MWYGYRRFKKKVKWKRNRERKASEMRFEGLQHKVKGPKGRGGKGRTIVEMRMERDGDGGFEFRVWFGVGWGGGRLWFWYK